MENTVKFISAYYIKTQQLTVKLLRTANRCLQVAGYILLGPSKPPSPLPPLVIPQMTSHCSLNSSQLKVCARSFQLWEADWAEKTNEKKCYHISQYTAAVFHNYFQVWFDALYCTYVPYTPKIEPE